MQNVKEKQVETRTKDGRRRITPLLVSTMEVRCVVFRTILCSISPREKSAILFWVTLNWRRSENNSFLRKENTRGKELNHKVTRIVSGGEDWHGLQTTNLKTYGYSFKMRKLWVCSFNLNFDLYTQTISLLISLIPVWSVQQWFTASIWWLLGGHLAPG